MIITLQEGREKERDKSGVRKGRDKEEKKMAR